MNKICLLDANPGSAAVRWYAAKAKCFQQSPWNCARLVLSSHACQLFDGHGLSGVSPFAQSSKSDVFNPSEKQILTRFKL
jgi:hypothetical protein